MKVSAQGMEQDVICVQSIMLNEDSNTVTEKEMRTCFVNLTSTCVIER